MIRLRPYRDSDADIILSWQRNEKGFYQWCAGMLGAYPPSRQRFDALGALMRFTALDEEQVLGFFTLRNPGESQDEVRFGYVIVDPQKRGKGYGAEMLRLGLVFARSVYRAKRATLGVFENNTAAYRCYRAVGFREKGETEMYPVMGEEWVCREMFLDL